MSSMITFLGQMLFDPSLEFLMAGIVLGDEQLGMNEDHAIDVVRDFAQVVLLNEQVNLRGDAVLNFSSNLFLLATLFCWGQSALRTINRCTPMSEENTHTCLCSSAAWKMSMNLAPRVKSAKEIFSDPSWHIPCCNAMTIEAFLPKSQYYFTVMTYSSALRRVDSEICLKSGAK
jgi:hypothetical protein